MKKIYAENYQTYPEEFKQKLLEAFDQSLKNKQTFYDVLRYQGKVAAFLRFDYLGEENGQFKKHFAAFNVNKNFTQAKLGEAMLKQALEREKLDSVIIAECDPQAPITRKYFELGFKKVKEFTLAGVPSLQIELRG
jgi:predicted GNAT family N-acyltransferase